MLKQYFFITNFTLTPISQFASFVDYTPQQNKTVLNIFEKAYTTYRNKHKYKHAKVNNDICVTI